MELFPCFTWCLRILVSLMTVANMAFLQTLMEIYIELCIYTLNFFIFFYVCCLVVVFFCLVCLSFFDYLLLSDVEGRTWFPKKQQHKNNFKDWEKKWNFRAYKAQPPWERIGDIKRNKRKPKSGRHCGVAFLRLGPLSVCASVLYLILC